MALILKTTFKGIEAEYWKITNLQCLPLQNTTYIVLSLYKDKTAREESIGNELTSKVVTLDGVDYTRETAYIKAKESKKVENIITPEVVDEDGITTPAVTEEVETNEFAGAIDDI